MARGDRGEARRALRSSVRGLVAGMLLPLSGSVWAIGEQERNDERQVICQGHEDARSWNHFLETTCLADVVLGAS